MLVSKAPVSVTGSQSLIGTKSRGQLRLDDLIAQGVAH
jgi:hypothetical protein